MGSLSIRLDDLNRIDIDRKGAGYELSIWKRERFSRNFPGFPDKEFTKWECESIVEISPDALVESVEGLKRFIDSEGIKFTPRHVCLPECTAEHHFEI
jgi:hypothetical protein